MPGSTGPSGYLGQKQEASLEPLALSENLNTFFWLGFLCHYRAKVKRGQVIFVGFQIQSKS